jgi:hypothetical protein
VEAFLAASRLGNFEALLTMLDPDAVLRADRAAVEGAAVNSDRGAPLLAPQVRGARAVAMALAGRATAAKVALIDGIPGAVWAPGGRPRAVFAFRVIGTTTPRSRSSWIPPWWRHCRSRYCEQAISGGVPCLSAPSACRSKRRSG